MDVEVHTMGMEKDDLKSLFKVHLHLAALDDDAWGSVLDVLNAYGQVKIKGQKAGDIPTQYVFGRLFKVKETSTKSKLLSALASGELTVATFRKKCARNGQENQNSQTSAIDSLLEDEVEDESYVDGTDDCSKTQHGTHLTRKGMKDNYRDDYSFMITSLEKEKELRKMAQSVLQQKCILIKEKEERIQQLIEEKEKLQTKHEKDLASVQHEMERYKRDNKAMMSRVRELEKQLANERMKCRAAEETAARARTMLQCSSTKTPLKRKTTSDGKETVPDKKTKTDQDIITDPKENAILIIALVEYNQGRVYYVLRDPEDTDKGIYFKAPIGYIKNGLFCHKPTKLSFVLNKKDVQSVDRKFIICEFTGVIEDGIIRVNKMSISPQEQVLLISNYVKQC